jgi:hypothetical protein
MRLGKWRFELAEGVKLKDVLARLKGRLEKFIRRIPEVDREAIIEAATAERPKIKEEVLAQIGVSVVRDDLFVIKPKQEKTADNIGAKASQ